MNSNNLAKKVAINFASELINKISPLIILFYVPRILGVTQFGYAQFGISLIELTLPFVAFGYMTVGSLNIGKHRNDIEASRQIISSIFYLKVAQAFIATATLLFFVSYFEAYREYQSLIWLLSMIIILASSDVVFVAIGIQKLHQINAVHSVFKAIGIGLVFLFVQSPSDAPAYAFLTLAPGVMAGLYSSFFAFRRYPLAAPNLKKMRELFAQGAKFAVVFYGLIIVERFDIILAEHFGGTEAAGLYAGPARLSHSLNQLALAIGMIFFSEIISVKSRTILTRHIAMSVWATMSFILPAAAGIWFVKGEILSLLFGSIFFDQGFVVGILLTGNIFLSLFFLFGLQLLILKGEIKFLASALAGSGTIGFLVSTTLFPHFDLAGIAIGSSVAKLVLATSSVLYSRQYLDSLPTSEILRVLLPTVLMVIILQVADFANPWLNLPLGSIVFIAGMFIANRNKPIQRPS